MPSISICIRDSLSAVASLRLQAHVAFTALLVGWFSAVECFHLIPADPPFAAVIARAQFDPIPARLTLARRLCAVFVQLDRILAAFAALLCCKRSPLCTLSYDW